MLRSRTFVAVVGLGLGAATLGGCISVTREASAPPPPPASTTVVVQQPSGPPQRVVNYPGGHYELRGNGAAIPYYWVWIPAGTTVMNPPSPPSTTAVITSATPRTIYYPEGRYELRGDGAAVPYYWVWIPAGSNPPYPPQPVS